jgi:hypothetical protein
MSKQSLSLPSSLPANPARKGEFQKATVDAASEEASKRAERADQR